MGENEEGNKKEEEDKRLEIVKSKGECGSWYVRI